MLQNYAEDEGMEKTGRKNRNLHRVLQEHLCAIEFKDEIEPNGANLSGRKQIKLLSAFVEVVF